MRPTIQSFEARRTLSLICLASMTAIGCAHDEASLAAPGDDHSPLDAGPMLYPSDDGDASPEASQDTAMCPSSECKAPYATCTNSPYVCGTDLNTDLFNCGGCGYQCPDYNDPIGLNPDHLWIQYSGCTDGRCWTTCGYGHADCDGVPDNGCETDLGCSSENCGACGHKCDPGVLCLLIAGNMQCGCGPGQTLCDGSDACDGQRCKSLNDDDYNCGVCGHGCTPADNPDTPPPGVHTHYGCEESECGKVKCDEAYSHNYTSIGLTYLHCSSNPEDGCEVNPTNDPLNCRACGVACQPGQICYDGACQCPGGTTACMTFENDLYCRQLDSDPDSCGACGYVCPGTVYFNGLSVGTTAPRMKRGCREGLCTLDCNPGYADCNGNLDDGCEANLMIDPEHCGDCNTQCDATKGQACSNGACLLEPCSPNGEVTR